MKTLLISLSIIAAVILLIGFVIIRGFKKGEMKMISTYFSSHESIMADACEFLKINKCYNTAYNQEMLEKFQLFRLEKHGRTSAIFEQESQINSQNSNPH